MKTLRINWTQKQLIVSKREFLTLENRFRILTDELKDKEDEAREVLLAKDSINSKLIEARLNWILKKN